MKKNERKKKDMIRCVDCENHFGEPENYMVYCKKIGVYRSTALRVCDMYKKENKTKTTNTKTNK